MTVENPANDPLVALAESFAERYRKGERLTVEEFAEQHPEFAERIREIFPALIVMEDLASPFDEPSDLEDFLDSEEPPRQIGDFRIVREIGRGGMGVVFEAEQVSLGRAVALKVLTRRLSLDARALERFRAEARSAGRLHHPRIVPVHDVGRADGLYYYTMQLISGQGLDVVLSEIQRVRGNSESRTGSGTSKVPARSNQTVQALARAMLSGEFSWPALPEGTTPADVSPLGHRSLGPSRPRPSSPTGSIAIPASSDQSSVANLDVPHYHRRIADIGQQVAESLDYAHSQGVLHRDIKPSNLLLDEQGDIWVTDFGLAKAVDSATASDGRGASGARLTETGDVVGTVRYMAPERFRGWSDPRSDVYALGLTLYELLALRPAFEESDRLLLIQNIKEVEPARLRTHDPRIPLDLETIVLKAIHKEPERRYQTAGELSEDLRNFLEHRPIAARRTTRLERVAHWIRRNPTLAEALAVVASLLVVVAIGASLFSWRLSRALSTSESLRTQTKQAELDRTKQLRQSLLENARSARLSALPGGRTLSLAALRKAAAIEPGLDLRNEAIAAMTRTDIQPVSDWTLHRDRTVGAYGPDLEFTLSDNEHGWALIHDGAGNQLQRFPIRKLSSGLFSRDGRFVLVRDFPRDGEPGTGCLRVFEWRSGREIVKLDGWFHGLPFDFHPAGTEFVARHDNEQVVFHELSDGKELRHFKLPGSVNQLRYHPSGRFLAFIEPGQPNVSMLDVETGEVEVLRVPAPAGLDSSISFNTDGTRIAAGSQNWRAYVWDTRSGDLTATLAGHGAEVTRTAFVPNSDIVVTSSWDDTIRLWDVREGRTLSRLDGTLLGISRDGRRLAFQSGNVSGIVGIIAAREYKMLRGHSGKNPRSCCFAPDGQMLVSCGFDGIRFWDINEGKSLGTIDLKGTLTAEFTATGDSLITASSTGVYRWPVRRFEDRWEIGPPEELIDELVSERRARLSPEQDRVVVASDDSNRLEVLSLTGAERRVISCGRLPNDCWFSPDGMWIVAASWRDRWCSVYDSSTGRLVRKLTLAIPSCCFSPDGQRLILTVQTGGQVWSTATWQIIGALPEESSGVQWGPLAFSPDGELLAVCGTDGVVRLLDGQDYHEQARLEPPTPQNVYCVAFSPDGEQLAVCTNGAVNVWNLRTVRTTLGEMKLDWAPPLPLPMDAPPSQRPRLVIDAGDLITGTGTVN